MSDAELEERIGEVIDAEIRPGLQMDGGDCEFIGYDEGVVRLRLQGACTTCASSVVTLQMGVERRLKEQFPQ
ncbi:MAG: NifU family protein, partial [Bdellovibrionota bacterium]